MWRVLYGPYVIYDPRDDDLRLTDMRGEVALNEAGFFEFTMPPAHPLAGRIECLQKDVEVVVEQDGEIVFCGRAMRALPDFAGSVKYFCEGERGYLNDVVLPAYSTAGKEGADKAPSEVDALFAWYVACYNAKVPPRHRFIVGVNEGALLDPNNHVLRESSQLPAVWTEIKEKLVDKLGGYVRVRHEGGLRHIDYLADGGKACAQRIEFGVNLLDYARDVDYTGYGTAVVPVGGEVEGADGQPAGRVGIGALPDGPLQEGYEKRGGAIVSIDGERRFGIVEKVVEFEDAETSEYLLQAGLRNVANRKVGDTLELTAVDLHQVDPSIERIALGSYVRAISKPHGLDEYFLCWRLPFAPGDPGNCTYTLGSTYDVLTGRQSARLTALNASISKQRESVKEISQAAKEAARLAEAAVVASWDEYALSESNGDPPADGWSAETPEWREGLYVWRRAVTAYGDGTTVEGAPAVMTGGKGEKGEDAVLLHIEATNGTAFKNNSASTVMEAVLFYGAERISDAGGLRAAFGPSARLQWRFRRAGEDEDRLVSASDARLSGEGFRFSITPEDVDNEATFKCDLVV